MIILRIFPNHNILMGLGHFPRTFPPDFSPEKNANNVVEIEAGMTKQYFQEEAGLMKQFVIN